MQYGYGIKNLENGQIVTAAPLAADSLAESLAELIANAREQGRHVHYSIVAVEFTPRGVVDIEDEDLSVCEACHVPHTNQHSGYVAELCKACEEKF